MSHTKNTWEKVREMHEIDGFHLGSIYAETLLRDPKHIAFTFSRYKFAAKMMHKCKHIIEIGCGEGLGTLLLQKETSAKITGIDFDLTQIDYAKKHISAYTNGSVSFSCQDIITTPYLGSLADGLVCLDVIEHIHHSEEKLFLQNCIGSLKPGGIAIFGTPNKHSEQYASPKSQEGHINLFYPDRLTSTLEAFFQHVFLFSMNDEMVHTGFNNLAHYFLALCVTKKEN